MRHSLTQWKDDRPESEHQAGSLTPLLASCSLSGNLSPPCSSCNEISSAAAAPGLADVELSTDQAADRRAAGWQAGPPGADRCGGTVLCAEGDKAGVVDGGGTDAIMGADGSVTRDGVRDDDPPRQPRRLMGQPGGNARGWTYFLPAPPAG